MWTDGVAYTYTAIKNVYVNKTDGSFVDYASWDRTPYLKCDGVSKLSAVAKMEDTTLLTSLANTEYNAFYDENKSFISSFSFKFKDGYALGDCVDIEVPANAVYFVVSCPSPSIGTNNNLRAPIVDFIPYA